MRSNEVIFLTVSLLDEHRAIKMPVVKFSLSVRFSGGLGGDGAAKGYPFPFP